MYMHKNNKTVVCLNIICNLNVSGITYDFIKIKNISLGIQLKQGINIACCK